MSQENTASIAAQLRQAREAQDKSLADIQRETGISPLVLNDLEAGRCDAVEPVFARMAVRQYADHLGLDGETIAKLFNAQFGGGPPPPPRNRVAGPKPSKAKSTGLPPAVFIGAAAVLCVIAAVVLLQPSAEDPAPQHQAPADLAPPPPPTAAAKPPPPPLPTPQAAPTVLVLEAVALDSTWIHITGDGGDLFKGVLPAGELRRWDAQDGFTLRSGHAHGVRYSLAGRPLGDDGLLGSPSQYLRARLTRDGVTLLDKDMQPLSATAP